MGTPTDTALDAKPTDPNADLKARMAAVLAKREAREAAAAPVVERAVLERKIADEEALMKAEDEIGIDDVGSMDTDYGLVVFRRPDPMRYRKYLVTVETLGGKNSETNNTKLIDEAMKLATMYVVHPEKDAFVALCEKLPGLANRIAGKLMDLAAGRAKQTAEK
jgi:hypothetical protein